MILQSRVRTPPIQIVGFSTPLPRHNAKHECSRTVLCRHNNVYVGVIELNRRRGSAALTGKWIAPGEEFPTLVKSYWVNTCTQHAPHIHKHTRHRHTRIGRGILYLCVCGVRVFHPCSYETVQMGRASVSSAGGDVFYQRRRQHDPGHCLRGQRSRESRGVCVSVSLSEMC